MSKKSEYMQEKDKKQNNPTAAEIFIEYIDTVNHQLREPVSNIFASLPIMAENISNNNTEAALENLNAVYRRTYSVIKCVNNLSVVSKLQSGYEYNKEIIDFSQLVKNVFQSSQMVLPQYFSLDCKADDGCIVRGSQTLLGIALFNLLLNSLDYRQEDVAVKVTLKKENNKCVLTYRDNSKGIRPEIIGSVFQPFYSADPYNDGEITNKFGLGLYIAKQAAEHAGGTILMQSEFGKGVNIVISVPQCSECETSVLKSRAADFVLNKYSDMYVQLCEYCVLPDLI
ncbi:MAG: HAMP domain-containing histidine kinase [Ruminococcaceae bacterium]|nr:HAMP domain-containing histidine kinase [Oscillospiraceae bacterium]